MATRSNIAYKTPEGKIRSIYCHWDGYPEHNGEMLNRYYTDQSKIEALIALGSLSSLNKELGEKQDFDARYNGGDVREDWCMAYHRDRGEELVISEYDDIPSWIADMEEYAYLWNGQDWLVNDHGETRGGFPVFDFVTEKLRPEVVKEIWG
jgi:hypothetical protein